MLETIWFVLWTLLWAVYFVLDGFDLGLGALLPGIARTEEERRIVYNASGPFWDGNEVWLIAAGGVTFAAFPKVYPSCFPLPCWPPLTRYLAVSGQPARAPLMTGFLSPASFPTLCWQHFWSM